MTQLPTFRSCLGPDIQAHVERKQALGRQFVGEAGILGDLDRFLAAHSEHDLTQASFAAWALTLGRLAPASRRQYLRIARGLCLYRRRSDPTCFVPDPAGFPDAGPQRPALIFSEQQILDLLSAADSLPAMTCSPLQPAVYRQTITLAYTSGLRCGELVRLTLGDCDLDQRTLLVRGSKGHKSRLVALSDSATAATDRYLAARCRFPHGSDAPLLAHGRDGSSPYSVRGIDLGFRRLFRDTGIVGVAGRPARLHDVRHTHAVHALLGWYRQGTDPQAKLPVLAASMGHVSLASTAYYLNLIEPVVRQAGERFADYARTIVAPPQEHSHA